MGWILKQQNLVHLMYLFCWTLNIIKNEDMDPLK